MRVFHSSTASSILQSPRLACYRPVYGFRFVGREVYFDDGHFLQLISLSSFISPVTSGTMTWSSSIQIGWLEPNSSIEAAICSICFFGCSFAFFGYGFISCRFSIASRPHRSSLLQLLMHLPVKRFPFQHLHRDSCRWFAHFTMVVSDQFFKLFFCSHAPKLTIDRALFSTSL